MFTGLDLHIVKIVGLLLGYYNCTVIMPNFKSYLGARGLITNRQRFLTLSKFRNQYYNIL